MTIPSEASRTVHFRCGSGRLWLRPLAGRSRLGITLSSVGFAALPASSRRGSGGNRDGRQRDGDRFRRARAALAERFEGESGRVGSGIIFFRLSSWELGLLFFAVLLGATGLGVFLGHRVLHLSDSLKEPFGILQGALLGVVGLLLAFGLSLAVSR
jgi:hypothetical protein